MSRTTRKELGDECLHHYLKLVLLDYIDELINYSKYTSYYNESCLLGLKKDIMEDVEFFENRLSENIDTR